MARRRAFKWPGKEHRAPFRRSARFDGSCRHHGGCPYCLHNRTHSERKRIAAALEQSVCDDVDLAAVVPAPPGIGGVRRMLARLAHFAHTKGELEE